MKDTRERLRDALTAAALAVGAGLVFLSPFPTGSQYQRHWSIVAVFAILLGALALLAWGLEKDARPRLDPMMVPLGCLVAIVILQLVPLPRGLIGIVSPTRLHLAREAAEAAGEHVPAWLPLTTCLKSTRDDLLLLVAYVSVFFAACTLFATKGRWKLIMGAAAAGGCVLAAWGIVQVLASRGGRLSATYTNWNRFAGLMAVTGACALGLFIAGGTTGGERRPKDGLGLPRGSIWLAAAVVIDIALVLTFSRLGIASALLAGLLTAAVFLRRRAVWAALSGTLLLLAVNAVLVIDPLAARYSVLFERGVLGSGRAQCWRMALPILPDFPVFGSGAGTFGRVFPMYQEPSLGGWWKFAHNDYLNLLCDTGVLGLAAAAVAGVFLMRRVLSMRSSRDPQTVGIAVAAFLALSAALFHSLGDFPLRQPANAVVLFALCGIGYGRALRRRGASEDTTAPAPRWVLPAAGVTAALLCGTTIPLLLRLRASGSLAGQALGIRADRGAEADAADLQRRAGLLERAAALDPWDAEVRYEAARTRVRLLTKNVYQGKDVQDAAARARELLTEGRRVSPLDPRAYYLSATLARGEGRADRADRLMRFAARLAPAWPDVAYHVGRYFLRRCKEERQGEPAAFGLHRWAKSDPTEDPMLAEISGSLAFAARSAESRGRTIALVLRHGLSSREVDVALQPDAEINLALARGLAGMGRHGEACTRYERALASGELSGPLRDAHVSCARSLLSVGRIDTALQQFDRAIGAAGTGELGETVRALADLRASPELAAKLADYWAAVSERIRDEPAVLLALGRAELSAGRDGPGFGHLLRYAEQTGDAAAFAGLARLTVKRGELDLAASLAAQATELDPRSVPYHMLRAEILLRLGDYRGAATSLEQVLFLNPRNLGAARELAGTEIKAGRHGRAIAVWRGFIECGGEAVPAHEALADIYVLLLDRSRAIEELSKALELDPTNERARAKIRRIREAKQP